MPVENTYIFINSAVEIRGYTYKCENNEPCYQLVMKKMRCSLDKKLSSIRTWADKKGIAYQIAKLINEMHDKQVPACSNQHVATSKYVYIYE